MLPLLFMCESFRDAIVVMIDLYDHIIEFIDGLILLIVDDFIVLY